MVKMKRVTVEVVIDCPLDKDPLKLIQVRSNLMVTSDKKVTKEESLDDIEHPSIQPKAEFFTLRQIIQDGIKNGLNYYTYLRIYGSRAKIKPDWNSVPGEFVYWIDYNDNNPVEAHALNSLEFAVDKGILTWFKTKKQIKTMSVGDPNIVNTIAEYMKLLVIEESRTPVRPPSVW